MGQHQAQDDVALNARARPQYHYFYGSTGTGTENGAEVADGGTEEEQGSLIGEGLVMTDNEDETPRNSEHELPHSVITEGWWRKSEGRPTSGGAGRTFVIIALALAMSTFLVVLFPHTSQPLPPAQAVFVPFPAVERADYGDPVEGFIDMDLFHPNLLSDDDSDSRTFVFPFPTGAFWTNLVVPPPDGEMSYPVAVYPYAYKWSETVLQISYPASHRFTDKHSIRDTFAPDLTFSTREAVQGRAVTRFDPLSVTLRFSTGSDKKWESSLVQGSPYITVKYVKTTPVLRALSIFKSVQCPGDDDENLSDLNNDDEDYDERRRLFGVCSMDVSA
jgi:endoglucanase Acf2